MSKNNKNSSDERLAKLEEELSKLKNEKTINDNRDLKKVYQAVKELQNSIDSLSHVFSTVQKTIMHEKQQGKNPDDKLDELLDQNEHIATAFMNMNNKIERLQEQIDTNNRITDQQPTQTTPKPNFSRQETNNSQQQNYSQNNFNNTQPSMGNTQNNNAQSNQGFQNQKPPQPQRNSQNQYDTNSQSNQGFQNQKPPQPRSNLQNTNNYPPKQQRQTMNAKQNPNAGLHNSNSMPGTSNYYLQKNNQDNQLNNQNLDTPPKPQPKKDIKELKKRNKGFLGGMFGK